MTHCRARGACIDFLPSTLTDDYDGYPVARSARGNLRRGVPVAASDIERARAAERSCPRRAVIITDITPPLQG
ncbi:ferredoxin [Corynebacterium falsenii]